MSVKELNRYLENTPYCVVYYNAGNNPQYKVVPRNEDGTVPDYFAARPGPWRSSKIRDVDIWTTGYLYGRSETNAK